MKKTSRLWWLHGAILVSAMMGCNRNCTNSGGCGPSPGGVPPYGPMTSGGPIGSVGGTAYTQGGAQPGIPSSSAFSGGGMPAGSAFPSSANSGYSMPGMSSGMQSGLGGARQ